MLDRLGLFGVDPLQANAEAVLERPIAVPSAGEPFTESRVHEGLVEWCCWRAKEYVAQDVQCEGTGDILLLAKHPVDGNHALRGGTITRGTVALLNRTRLGEARLQRDLRRACQCLELAQVVVKER